MQCLHLAGGAEEDEAVVGIVGQDSINLGLVRVDALEAVDEDGDEVREGLGSCGMNVRVRWTVPVVGDVADGARPPPELIADRKSVV